MLEKNNYITYQILIRESESKIFFKKEYHDPIKTWSFCSWVRFNRMSQTVFIHSSFFCFNRLGLIAPTTAFCINYILLPKNLFSFLLLVSKSKLRNIILDTQWLCIANADLFFFSERGIWFICMEEMSHEFEGKWLRCNFSLWFP